MHTCLIIGCQCCLHFTVLLYYWLADCLYFSLIIALLLLFIWLLLAVYLVVPLVFIMHACFLAIAFFVLLDALFVVMSVNVSSISCFHSYIALYYSLLCSVTLSCLLFTNILLFFYFLYCAFAHLFYDTLLSYCCL